jgi:homoserine kinase
LATIAAVTPFEVAVPATLSNLGPGFDVLGLAVELENRFRFGPPSAPGRWEADGAAIAPDEHLTFRTLRAAAARFGGPLPDGLALAQEEAIPRSRGLGSSATARVAGLVAWRQLTGRALPLEDAIAFVAEGEGHPDNAVPALVGGLTLCAPDGAGVRHLRLEPPAVTVALAVPARTVSTDAARAALPTHYPRADLVFGAGRLAFLMVGLLRGDPEALRFGVEDRTHHPYRAPLIGPVDDALTAAREAGATAAFISGSGSTLAALITTDGVDALAVTDALAAPFEAEGVACQRLVTRPRATGAWSS